ncbi:HAD-IC family P-type ATPase [Actinocrispum wychmicini]|uniref:P-type E1-E2 ATPase n=1 Tax=Actinocrispum wychmicini TaxID=1213861 RepID=A0A4R2JTZ5_9PSEU|nr:HAD-IC family P-type ATPase [Actinocrispum wychmicini]TCO60469.1 P-type E1-E2 ATPase [Actinocrispum wychmicini]
MITGQDRAMADERDVQPDRVGQTMRLLAVPALVIAVLLALLAVLVTLLGMSDSGLLWTVAAVAGLAPLAVWTAADLAGRKVGGALLAVPVVIAALVLRQHEVGTAVGMLACLGRWLEAFVWRRARRDLTVLAGSSPDLGIRTGDRVRVGTGDIVPVDGRLLADAVIDEAPLSGDPIPVLRARGEAVRSGVINAGEPFELVATVPETEGTWAAMARLARRAVTERVGVDRRADRAALLYLALALLAAGVLWLVTHQALAAFALLAVAAPGPVLLAAPLALAAGTNRASRQGVVVGDADVLSRLGRVRVGVVDSAGVVTLGTLSVTEVVAAPGWLTDDVLALAASVRQFRPDPLSGAVVRAAKAAGVRDSWRTRKVVVTDTPPDGGADWVRVAAARAALDNAGPAWVIVDGQAAGALLVRDEVRPEAADSLRRLRSVGIRRLVLVTRGSVNDPEDVGVVLGVDELWTGCGTADKVERVREERRRGFTMMVGDDPAVGAADVGVALSGRGTCVADVIIADGRVARLADAVWTARRSRLIAALTTTGGLAVVLGLMSLAAMGWVVPILAVLGRSAVDVLVMGLALRALRRARPVDRLMEVDHDHLRPVRLAVRKAADDLSSGMTPQAERSVLKAYHLISDHVVPMQRTGEIEKQVRRLGAHLATPNAQVDDLRATLYGLNAVLSERLIVRRDQQ